MRASQKWRMISKGTNALASYIVLVTRPKPADAPIATRREFVGALSTELAEALRHLQHVNVAPVDLAQAALGPGMAIFSRFSKVVEASGNAMTVRTALTLINQAVDEILDAQVSEYDPSTRWAVSWFEQHGVGVGDYGEAETLFVRTNTSSQGLVRDGVIEARAGKVRLLNRSEMSPDWDPVTDARLTIWEACQHLARVLENDGEQAAGRLLRRLGQDTGAQARDLAYRLFTTSEKRKWSQEAQVFNALVVAWPEIVRFAAGDSAEQGSVL